MVHCQKSSSGYVLTSIFKNMFVYVESKNIDFYGRLHRICVPVLQDINQFKEKKFERHNAVGWLFWNTYRVTDFGALWKYKYIDMYVFNLLLEM